MNVENKIKTRDELVVMCEKWRAEGKKIGFTSGNFDFIHAGHADFLEKAKKECDILIAGVNTDDSVRKYKGDEKPITPEQERVYLVASFGAVDFVFLFEERRNKENLRALKPDLYMKAGDYDVSRLTSRVFVEEHGGQAKIIPIRFETSSSNLIGKLTKVYGKVEAGVVEEEGTVHFPTKHGKKHRAIFLDRDGTINEEVEYLHEPEKFKLLANAGEGLKKMQDMEFKLAVVTLQAGIGLGYFTKEDFYKVNSAMFMSLRPFSVKLDKIYFCGHSFNDPNCDCRKPKIGLFERAEKDLNLDMKGSWMIGDKTSDIEAGKRAGCRTILVTSGKRNESEFKVQPDYVACDLLDAANHILEHERKL